MCVSFIFNDVDFYIFFRIHSCDDSALMRKWFLFLVILGLIFILSKASRKKEARSPFHKRFNETVSIVVWVVLIAYVVSFIYWLYTQIFK